MALPLALYTVIQYRGVCVITGDQDTGKWKDTRGAHQPARSSRRGRGAHRHDPPRAPAPAPRARAKRAKIEISLSVSLAVARTRARRTEPRISRENRDGFAELSR